MNRLHRMFILRAILLLVMALNVYSKLNKNIFLFYHLIILILILNEFFRYLLINKKSIMKSKNNINKITIFISLILSLVILSYLSYYHLSITFYIFFILFESFYFKGVLKIILFIINYLSYITPLALSNTYINSFLFNIYNKTISRGFIINIVESSISYFSYFIIVMLIKKVRKNKKNIYILNQELKEQNLKLKEYSKKIEELTISKERNRVAQELHDSLGHYLMAISMHIDVLDKTLDISPEKSKNILSKTKIIVDNSIDELRSTVYSLKKNNINIISSVNSLTENLSISNNISFNVNISNDIENVSLLIKDALYKTIKESITNGIKHGKASQFIIDLFIKDNIIYLSILNNGIKPNNIIKSNGLNGMEDRLKVLNGKLNVENTLDGFKVSCTIPLIK
ncbi:Sensor histidine kinase desK [Sarcina ventriculi]|uniref:histidine kinase n=2 Tax=Sarcina ventriculi TaxID=1267 RepID=A0ABM9UNP0_SARVE|nr:Sensor histidine kinase desK [Sarcina ventriculi]